MGTQVKQKVSGIVFSGRGVQRSAFDDAEVEAKGILEDLLLNHFMQSPQFQELSHEVSYIEQRLTRQDKVSMLAEAAPVGDGDLLSTDFPAPDATDENLEVRFFLLPSRWRSLTTRALISSTTPRMTRMSWRMSKGLRLTSPHQFLQVIVPFSNVRFPPSMTNNCSVFVRIDRPLCCGGKVMKLYYNFEKS